ncbi:MAG: DHHA1 domain-containing protein [Nitrospiraceae bacterium]|nr:DHHA1 domain-containing protein [Nitrospiraceae bacterium]
MHRRWFINKTNPEFLSYITKSASISPVLAQVLINRGIRTPEAIREFMRPSATALSDPFELSGMRAAVERIQAALKKNERVLVHGDYDADGLTATAIVVRAMTQGGLDVRYFIPGRMIHGYGFTPQAVELAMECGARLIITVDCGITSFEAAAAARRAGIDVIITDHHEPLRKRNDGHNGDSDSAEQPTDEPVIPEALSVINPKLPGHAEGVGSLSGAGVAFKLIHALALEGIPGFSVDSAFSLLDLAAVGTVADVVPLSGENRVLVREGLKLMQAAGRPGLRALRDVCNLSGREMKSGLLSYTMVPRINAAGRMAESRDVVRLLLTGDDAEAAELSAWLDRLNAERQATEEVVYQEAMAKLEGSGVDGAVVLAGEGWHQGVLGIVASRIAEAYYRPTFILSVEDRVAKGSGRSIPVFDICKGLAECSHLLLSFGGHRQAAGVRLNTSDIRTFHKAINELVKRSVDSRDLTPTIEIDALVSLSDITHPLMEEIAMLEPFGYGNAEPLFGSRGLEVVNPRSVGHNHLKMRLKKFAQSMDTIGFDMWGVFDDLNQPTVVDAAFTPGFNEWNGNRYLQLVVKALRPSR